MAVRSAWNRKPSCSSLRGLKVMGSLECVRVDGKVCEQSHVGSRTRGTARLRARLWSNEGMKKVLNMVGTVLMVFGGIWFLQGINVLPGSFMTGQIQWAIYGGIAFVVGLALLAYSSTRGT